jgi:hypothetical protein
LLRGIALELAASDCQTGGMDSAVMRLLSIAHRPLSDANPGLPPATAAAAGPLAGELIDMLTARNGFFAFGPALHVFPCESCELSWGLVDWNMPGLWKHEYLSFVDPGLCFAEDIFGNQFSIKDGSVHYFEVETGALKTVAASLDEWADLILADDQLWTGWPFAERWPSTTRQSALRASAPRDTVRLRRKLRGRQSAAHGCRRDDGEMGKLRAPDPPASRGRADQDHLRHR